ncbi:MAG: hypothetical protein M3P14_07525 [Chloroflexota bacterium]|nr:hypothetical protein [Chloroflexota bacterium]
MAFLRAFGRFWYDFLVGDRWELFVGPVATLTIVWLLLLVGLPNALAGGLLFVLVVAVGAVSIGWGRRSPAG